MTRARPDHEVAEITGESIHTVNRLGFSVLPDDPADMEPVPLFLVINCPHCRNPASYPGQLPDGSSPRAECPGYDAVFDYDIRDVYVTASRPGKRPARPGRRATGSTRPRRRRSSSRLTLISTGALTGSPVTDPKDTPDMITLTRRQVRCLRGVFRRHALGITGKGPVPPLVLRSEGSQLRAQHRYGGLAVEHVNASDVTAPGVVAVPLDALAEFEGRDDSPVMVEAVAPDRTTVRWADRGIPQAREYAVPTLDTLAAFPDPPTAWSECPLGLLDALAEATVTGADDNTRYALNCLQLRGNSGEVVATDGRQLLVQGGFTFPWEGDVLVRRSPIFVSKQLPRDHPVSVGKTDTHVVLRVAPWTLFLGVQDARFPGVDQAIPDVGATATRLRLDPEDGRFLLSALDRLPGADDLNSPATLDLNGRIAVRTRGADQERATELVLASSSYTGAPVRVNANREFLARAVRLGLTEVEIVDADSPVVMRDCRRVFCFQPLSKESAIGPADDVTRIESLNHPPTAAPRTQAGPPKARSTVSERTSPNGPDPKGEAAVNGRVAAEVPAPAGLAGLIQEAESLHEALSDARTRAGRLVVALRKQKRRERLVQSTLASLRQLKLQDVAG